MNQSKIKTIVILMLLIVNIIFLTLFIIGRAEKGKLNRQAETDIVGIMAENGITMTPSVIKQRVLPETLSLTRSTEKERQIASTVLGEVAFTDLGGKIYRYDGISGQAVFHGSGEFSITLNDGIQFTDRSASVLTAWLKKMGLDCDASTIETKTEDSLQSVTLTCVVNGVRVFNSSVTLTFNGERLVSVGGHHTAYTLRSAAESTANEASMGVYTALMQFLRGIKGSGYVCNEIRSVTAGYSLGTATPGDEQLTAFWCVDTDSGKYYVNGLTGEMLQTFS